MGGNGSNFKSSGGIIPSGGQVYCREGGLTYDGGIVVMPPSAILP